MYAEKILHSKDHLKTSDVRFEDGIRFAYTDAMASDLERLKQIQLYDSSVWAKFVYQFAHPGADDADSGWRGEYWGKMMRGACYTYRSALVPDEKLYSVLTATVEDMLGAQDGLGRFSTYTVAHEFHGWDIWARKYIMLGFIYFLDICRDPALADRIVAAVMRHADYMIGKIGEGKLCIAECTDNWDGLNSCSICEPFVLLYNITKEPRYLDFARYILSFGGTRHQNLFDLAYEDKLPVCRYSVTKAYEMISCFEGLAEYSKVIRETDPAAAGRAAETVVRFADRVLAEEDTIIGCLGCHFESFDHAVTEQFNAAHTGIMLETCVTVTWMKFLWQLWRMTGNAKYMDALEVSAYNAMSAALRRHIDPAENGGVALPIHSYNPLRHDVRTGETGGNKTLDAQSHYGCCVCISSCGFALQAIASAAYGAGGTLYLNLYRAGRIDAGEIVLDIATDYPYAGGKVDISVTGCAGERTIALRIPAWSKHTSLAVGGKPVEVKPAGGYVTVNVRAGTKIELGLDVSPRAVYPRDCTETGVDDYISVFRGPLVYALDECEDREPVLPLGAAEVTSAVPVDPDKANVACRSALGLNAAGREAVLVDYASAGQDDGHKVCAWIRTKQ